MKSCAKWRRHAAISWGCTRGYRDLLRQNGGVIHCARDEEEMEELLKPLDLDIAVVGAPERDV